MNGVATLDPSQGCFHEYGAFYLMSKEISNDARPDASQQGKEQYDVAGFCFLSFIYLTEIYVFLLQADASTPVLSTGSYRR